MADSIRMIWWGICHGGHGNGLPRHSSIVGACRRTSESSIRAWSSPHWLSA